MCACGIVSKYFRRLRRHACAHTEGPKPSCFCHRSSAGFEVDTQTSSCSQTNALVSLDTEATGQNRLLWNPYAQTRVLMINRVGTGQQGGRKVFLDLLLSGWVTCETKVVKAVCIRMSFSVPSGSAEHRVAPFLLGCCMFSCSRTPF